MKVKRQNCKQNLALSPPFFNDQPQTTNTANSQTGMAQKEVHPKSVKEKYNLKA